MDIGLQGIQAFLPKKKLEKYVAEFLDGVHPTVGQLVPCVVTQLSGPAAKLSAEPSKLRSNVSEVKMILFVLHNYRFVLPLSTGTQALTTLPVCLIKGMAAISQVLFSLRAWCTASKALIFIHKFCPLLHPT